MKRILWALGALAGMLLLGGCYYSAAYQEGYDCRPHHGHYHGHHRSHHHGHY